MVIIAGAVVTGLLSLAGRGGEESAPSGRAVSPPDVPLTKLVEPPRTFPRPKLVVRGADGTWIPQGTGSVLHGEWLSRERIIEFVPAPAAPRWPDPVHVKPGGVAGVLLPGDAAPRTVTVKTFGRPLGANGAPRGRVLETIECSLSALLARHGACAVERERGGYVLRVPTPPARGFRRVAVHATWAEPRTTRRDIGVAWGAWLYTMKAPANSRRALP